MIIVLADDFSGAAEIAGIAKSYGLTVEILCDMNIQTDADLVVIDSNTRSVKEAEAVRKVTLISRRIVRQKAAWIFKKIDSVLRGHIRAEIVAMSGILKRKRVLIVPANPSRKRVLTAGTYTIDGIPLNKTVLAADPEFPRRSAKISKLLPDVSCISKTADQRMYVPIPEGLAVAESADLADVRYWAHQLTDDTLPVGAADFFRAILESKGTLKRPESKSPAYRAVNKRLIILGSRASAQRWQSGELDYTGWSKYSLILTLTGDHSDNQKRSQFWTDQILNALRQGGQVVVSVSLPPRGSQISPREILKIFSQMTVTVIKRAAIEELVIEGGATASQILRALHWNRFQPVRELANGVVVLKILGVLNTRLIVKPGSYKWPAQLWQVE